MKHMELGINLSTKKKSDAQPKNRSLFPPASRQPPSSLYLKSLQCLVLMIIKTCNPDKVLWETCCSAHESQHPCQPMPLQACIQNQQIHRGCHIHRPPLSPHTPREEQQLHENAICWLLLSIHYNLTHDTAHCFVSAWYIHWNFKLHVHCRCSVIMLQILNPKWQKQIMRDLKGGMAL